jgi:hypothetical protein
VRSSRGRLRPPPWRVRTGGVLEHGAVTTLPDEP